MMAWFDAMVSGFGKISLLTQDDKTPVIQLSLLDKVFSIEKYFASSGSRLIDYTCMLLVISGME